MPDKILKRMKAQLEQVGIVSEDEVYFASPDLDYDTQIDLALHAQRMIIEDKSAITQKNHILNASVPNQVIANNYAIHVGSEFTFHINDGEHPDANLERERDAALDDASLAIGIARQLLDFIEAEIDLKYMPDRVKKFIQARKVALDLMEDALLDTNAQNPQPVETEGSDDDKKDNLPF
jgi:hypothetical protein